jgi:predicted amidophosphoribosyltransferase
MSSAVDLPAGEPLGFPSCRPCPYAMVGPARICVACASTSLDRIGPNACPVCRQVVEPGTSCRNWLCNDPGRHFDRVDAIAYYSGQLGETIRRYKYDGATGWKLIFGRLLVGWLEAHARDDPPDLIVANPAYVVPGAGHVGHVEAIIQSAALADIDRRWSFDSQAPAAIIKMHSTPKSAGQTAAAKRTAATQLYDALRVPDPARIAGRRILIFDDICTTGSQFNVVARRLLEDGGAAGVRGLVLGRAPWR